MKLYLGALTAALLIFAAWCVNTMNGNGANNQSSVNFLESKINKTLDNLNETNARVFDLEMKTLPKDTVYLTPASKDYSRIETGNGDFLIALRDLKKYANGYKARFVIGNPGSLTYNNVHATLNWGRSCKVDKSYLECKKTWNKVETNIKSELLPMTWNNVSFTLSPATEEDIANISVSLQPNIVSLKIDRRKFEE